MSKRACLLVVLPLLLSACSSLRPAPRATGPWDLQQLQHAPAFDTGGRTGLVQEIYYVGPTYRGKPTRVFAYLGQPANATATRRPGMILVHGGGGKAFRDWAQHWAERGYAALAMDLSGNGPSGRLPDGAPDQADTGKFRNFTTDEAREMWTYHAVADVILAHSLLRSLPEVDPERIGLTGISWGGYLTCIVAGLDPRFKVAVPVYGCGFLGDNSVWKDGALAAMAPDSRERWLHLFDPSQHLADVRCPILFLNGTTDFAYPLDSYQKSYRLVPEHLRHVSIVTNLPHGHIWTFGEVDAFVDQALAGAPPLAKPGIPVRDGDTLRVRITSQVPLKQADLCYTSDTGPWNKRQWVTVRGSLDGKKASAPLPAVRPLVAFFAVIDERGLRVSSEFIQLP